jgi:hypothetical protein
MGTTDNKNLVEADYEVIEETPNIVNMEKKNES